MTTLIVRDVGLMGEDGPKQQTMRIFNKKSLKLWFLHKSDHLCNVQSLKNVPFLKVG